MDKNKKTEQDDPEQSQRFIETAQAVGAENSKPFDKALKALGVAPPKLRQKKAGPGVAS